MVELIFMDPGYLGALSHISYSFYECQWGAVLMAATPDGLCWLTFVDDPQKSLKEIALHYPDVHILEQSSLWQKKAEAILDGDNSLSINIHVPSSSLQQKVWNALLQIPSGYTRSYSDIAAEIGKPKAARAVGTVIGQNPIAYLIPCHRVIQRSGNLAGYRWGLSRKVLLLQSEKKGLGLFSSI